MAEGSTCSLITGSMIGRIELIDSAQVIVDYGYG